MCIMTFFSLYHVFVLIFCMASETTCQQEHVCKQITDCKCQFEDDGAILDISSEGNTDGTPRFKDVPSKDGYLYSFNPCGGFTEDVCANAAVCRKNRLTGVPELVGSATPSQFTFDELTGDTVIAYTAGTLANIHTFVYLICNPSENPGPPELFPNGTETQNLFLLTLYSPCACEDRCDSNGLIKPNSSNSSLVTYLIIAFSAVGVVVLYVIVASVVTSVSRSRGEMSRPVAMFFKPGSLVWDGLKFVFSRCFRRNYQDMA